MNLLKTVPQYNKIKEELKKKGKSSCSLETRIAMSMVKRGLIDVSFRKTGCLESKYKERAKKEKRAGRKQPKSCEICKCERTLCFDHDHKTDKFRGWICQHCNSALGFVNDDTKILKKMIEYLQGAKSKE